MTLEKTATATQYNINPRDTICKYAVCLTHQDYAYRVELRNGGSRRLF